MDSSPPNGLSGKPRSRKRNRPAVSCGHCRIRKLKCSRTQPCDSCLRAGDADTCSYETAPGPRENKDELDPGTKRAMTARIDRLEAMLLSAMSTGAKPTIPTPNGSDRAGSHELSGSQSPTTKEVSKLDRMVSAFGAMKVDHRASKTVYIDGSHWVSMMTEIDELREHLLDHHESWERDALEHRDWILEKKLTASLLRGIVPHIPHEQLLIYLPPREVMDGLIDRYFEVYSMTLPIIHEPTFRKEYSHHWEDPTSTKSVWLGMLYAMLHLAEVSYADRLDNAALDSIDTYKLNNEYKRSIVRCLVSSDYTVPVMYTIETLVMYVTSEWITSPDASLETSLVLGMAIRLAMRMGIHRDSKWQPQITPWQGEMRRRLWAVLQGTDIQYSFHLSIPPNIRPSDCDSALPRNIYNDEFGRDTVELPPSRPLEERTEVCYTICKTKLDIMLGDIINLVNSPGLPTLADVHRQEATLLKAWNEVPPHLIAGYNNQPSSSDPARWKELQTKLERTYLLSQCILYRKFIHRAYQDASFMRYRNPCAQAALKLLAHQSALFLDLNAFYWQGPPNVREMSALGTPDFFTAGMVVALDLYYGVKAGYTPCDASDDAKERREMISALETSLNIWRLFISMSIEAAKAYGMFSFILSKAKAAMVVTDGKDTESVPHTTQNQDFSTIQAVDISQFDAGFWNLNSDSIDYENLLQWPPPNVSGI
ncbi:fungal-specific transcription factor domain-containing protein [Xylogone sp. PMI_703]|nr:fungal-specific transcription factor domain-containing protein [Xylogone sp. PMI_703]